MKKANKGSTLLIKREEWVSAEDISGTDELVLNHTVMVKAQEEILKRYEPRHKICLVSLCTKTRPYSKGRKWRTFLNEFSNVDFIINSSGGVIPIKYESCYPYLNYDGDGDKIFNELYITYTVRNLIRFFIHIDYDYIVFNFRPNLRNVKAAQIAGKYLQDMGYIKGWVITPNEEVYKKAQANGFAKLGLSMYPDLHPIVLEDIKEKIEFFNKKLGRKKRRKYGSE